MPTTRFISPATADLVSPTASVSAAELAFFNRPETRAWWEAIPDNGQKLQAKDYWEDRKNGYRLGPVNAVKPDSLSSGGPDGAPVVQSLSTGLDPDTLANPSGQTVTPAGDLCLWAVAKAGTNSTATLMSLVGNNGGSLSLRLRNSDLVQAVVYTGGQFLTRISQTLASAAYHLVQLNYNHAVGEISIWANGALLSGLTPASGKFSYTHGFPSGRIAVLGLYDLALGDQDVLTRSLPIAMCGVATTHAPDNPAWQAALEAMVAEKYPSLGL